MRRFVPGTVLDRFLFAVLLFMLRCLQFQQKHADWEPALSLSKIRSLKFKVAKLWHEYVAGFLNLMTATFIVVWICGSLDRDLSTVALAIVFFEKLVLKKFVKKVLINGCTQPLNS